MARQRRRRSAGVLELDFFVTAYFESRVLVKRHTSRERCASALSNAPRVEPQWDGDRVGFWAEVPELDGRVLRVVTLADQRTIHNAFPDRRFRP